MQLHRNTLVPIAIGMLAVAAARAEAAPLVHAGGAAQGAMHQTVIWGLDFAERMGAFAQEMPAASAEGAPAVVETVPSGEMQDGAAPQVACCEETTESAEPFGIEEASWGFEESTDAVEATATDAPECAPEACGEASDVVPAAELAAPAEAAIELIPAVLVDFDVAAHPMPIYVSLCMAVVDAVKADLALPSEEESGADEGDEGCGELESQTAEALWLEDGLALGPCCDEEAEAATEAPSIEEVETVTFAVEETYEADLTALVSGGDARAALAAASSLRRGFERFLEAAIASFAPQAAPVEEIAGEVEAGPDFGPDHVPQVLTLF